MPKTSVSASFMARELVAYEVGATTCTLYRWLLWVTISHELSFHTILARVSLSFSTQNNFIPLMFYSFMFVQWCNFISFPTFLFSLSLY
jgi:hypothetical protein